MAAEGGGIDYDAELDEVSDIDVLYPSEEEEEEEEEERKKEKERRRRKKEEERRRKKEEIDKTQPFSMPGAASTPYHGGEQHEMQTMMREQSGLPSYDESTPLLSTSDIERRLWDLKTNPRTGIIDATQMDISNPLSEEDRAEQIERVKKLIKAQYPNANLKSLVIRFSTKNPMDIVVVGAKGGETKIVLNNGSGLQKSFLNLTYVKRALGPSAPQIIDQQSVKISARQKVLEEKNVDYRNEQQNFKRLDDKIEKKSAKVAQLKEEGGNEEEIKREEQVIQNLKKDKKISQEKITKIAKENEKEQQTISEDKRKRNVIEKKFYDTKNIDVLKEKETHLQQQKEKYQALIDDSALPELLKDDARDKMTAVNEELARIQTRVDERVAEMPLRERVREIFKKYGVTVTAIFLAAGVTIGAVVGAITNALKTLGNQLANGLKTVGAKAASALPGLIGSIVSFLFKTAGQAIGYLAEHTWLLILAAVVFIFEKYIKRR